MQQKAPFFERKRVVLNRHESQRASLSRSRRSRSRQLQEGQDSKQEEYTPTSPTHSKEIPSVLVINSSNTMARAITTQLFRALPRCSIMYAPTIELAEWMLKRRKISLIVSSEVMPDGGIAKLHGVIRRIQNPPDVIMVGRGMNRSVIAFRDVGYKLVARKELQPEKETPEQTQRAPKTRSTFPRVKKVEDINQKVSTLSADLRNDLNNPLQEIVTLAFVMKQSGGENQIAEEAVSAIEKAAKLMAGTVNGLEDRIKKVVIPA